MPGPAAGWLWVALAGVALLAGPAARAQDAAQVDLAVAAQDGAAASANLLTPEELDTLVGPVALFTDNLLTQVMMATTYPLDVVKADRFLAQSKDLSDRDRADAIAAQDWDESVRQLATGFPTVITRMAEHIDWTEQMGDAVLAQTDDVLDSVQRLRAAAEKNGYLEDNAAQVVQVTENNISIAPATPDVIYVPTYEPSVVYTTPAPATPYYVSDNDDWTDALTAGAIFFGSAILIDEIFDDDDWDGYWGGHGSIDWDDGDFYPRPGINGDVNINGGDINIDRGDRFTNIDRGDRITNIERGNVTNIDRNNLDIDRTRIEGNRIGDVDREALDRERDKNFRPATADRDAARAKIENRKAGGGQVATLPVGSGDRQRPAAGTGAKRPDATRPELKKPDRALSSTKAQRPTAGGAPKVNRPQNVARPATPKRPNASAAKPKLNANAFEKTGGARAAAAGNRGRASAGGGRRR